MKKETMDNIIKILGDEKELHIFRGQIQAPVKNTNTNKETYYTFNLKTVTSAANDEYSTNSNVYHCVMPAEISKQYSDIQISELKDYEVIIIASMSARVKNFKKEDQTFKYNNINIFIQSIDKVRQIQRKDYTQRTVNL
jgi:hypothetical protein